MGCSQPRAGGSSNSESDSAGADNANHLISQRQRYCHNHETFTLLLLDDRTNRILNESNTENEQELMNFINRIYNEFHLVFEKEKMGRADVTETLLQKILEPQIEDKYYYRKINIQNVISDILENNKITNPTINKEELMRSFLLFSRRYFPQVQKFIDVSYFDNSKNNMNYILSTLKFNSKYRVNLLKITFDSQIGNDQSLVNSISDLIRVQSVINAVIIDIKVGVNRVKENLQPIFNAIYDVKLIGALVLSSDYTLNMGEVVSKSLFSTLKEDRLFSLTISGIGFEKYLKEFFSILEKLENLKYLVFDLKEMMDEDVFSYIVSNYLKKNKKIIFCCLCGGSLNIDDEDIEDEIKTANPFFKNFCYIRKLNLF